MALATYSARGINIELTSPFYGNKKFTATGYAPDEFLMIETEDDDFTTEEGADGFVTRSLIPNKIAKITITLQQTSPFNKVLTLMRNIDTGSSSIAGVGAGVFSLDISEPLIGGDINKGIGGDIFNCGKCYVSKVAPINRAKESGTRAWEITCVDGIFRSNDIADVIKLAGSITRDAVTFNGTLIN